MTNTCEKIIYVVIESTNDNLSVLKCYIVSYFCTNINECHILYVIVKKSKTTA